MCPHLQSSVPSMETIEQRWTEHEEDLMILPAHPQGLLKEE